MDCRIDSRMLNNIAIQKLLTENPSISLCANRIIRAFITRRNSPKVMIVMGRVNITKIGLTKRFKIDSTTATITAVKKVSTSTPFRTLARIITATAFNNKRTRSFIIDLFKY